MPALRELNILWKGDPEYDAELEKLKARLPQVRVQTR